MVYVKMTHDLSERPPKVAGPFDRFQITGITIAGLIIVVLINVLPFSLMTNLAIACVPALAAVILFFSRKSQKMVILYMKVLIRNIKALFIGTEVWIHDGNTVYYKKKKVKTEKIRRHKEYKGIK